MLQNVRLVKYTSQAYLRPLLTEVSAALVQESGPLIFQLQHAAVREATDCAASTSFDYQNLLPSV